MVEEQDLNFRQFVENEFVYRIDKNPISDFSKERRTYHRSPDWTSSGTFGNKEKIPPDWHKETGLFAGELKHVIPYAVPRDVKWIVTYENPKRPTVMFSQIDKARMAGYKPYLSKFSASSFTKVPSGEFFSSDPRQASRQEIIRNPLNFIRQWYNVKFVPDVVELAKQLRSQNIHFDGEGI